MSTDHPEPWANIRPVSTTSSADSGKIKRPRRGGIAGRRQATPHRLASRYGIRTPVTMTVRIMQSSSIWLEVTVDQGVFFVPFDASVFDLVERIIRGDYVVQPVGMVRELAHRQGVSHLTGGGSSATGE